MGKQSKLYIICLILFPVAFAGFVVGFGCPVWLATSAVNHGLWQACSNVFKDCTTLDFDDGGDWMIGVRAVEIFALVMLAVVAAELVYESCCTNFTGRKHAERLAPGVICAIGGLGGLAGIIVYAVKMDDVVTGSGGWEYGWAFMLVAAGSGLAFLLGMGFCISGLFMENTTDPDKTPINAYLPSSQGGDSYVMSAYTNKGMMDDPADRGPRPSINGHLPGHALYNGFARTSFSSPMDAPLQEPPYYHHRPTPAPPGQMKSTQYYSYSGEDGIPREFDLSEGYLPSRPRAPPAPPAPPADPYYSRGIGASSRAVEDPYLHRAEDPYSRGRRVDDDARGMGAGYLGSSTYFDGRGAGGRGYDAFDDRRESLYRSGRY